MRKNLFGRPPKDLCKLIVTILTFSFLSTAIIAFISKKFLKKEKILN